MQETWEEATRYNQQSGEWGCISSIRWILTVAKWCSIRYTDKPGIERCYKSENSRLVLRIPSPQIQAYKKLHGSGSMICLWPNTTCTCFLSSFHGSAECYIGNVVACCRNTRVEDFSKAGNRACHNWLSKLNFLLELCYISPVTTCGLLNRPVEAKADVQLRLIYSCEGLKSMRSANFTKARLCSCHKTCKFIQRNFGCEPRVISKCRCSNIGDLLIVKVDLL